MNTKTETKSAHTKTPWQAHGCTIYSGDYWKDGSNYGGRRVACTFDSEAFPDDMPTDEDSANADFIALACNSHYELLEACKALLDAHNAIDPQYAYGARAKAKAAITRAEGGRP